MGVTMALCSGCFDVLQEIWLEAGGGGRLRLELSLPKALLAMGRFGGDDLLVSVREDAANVKADMAKDPDIRNFEYRTVEEPDAFKLVYEVEAKDASKLVAAQARALAALARRSGRDGGSGGGLRQSPVDFSVERKLGLGLEFTGALRAGAPRREDRAGDELGKAVAGAMLGGHTITVRLHAPFILSSNGTLDEAHTTAEWKVPLSSLVEPGFRQEMTAQALSVDWKMGAGLVLGAVLIAGWMLGRLTARRR
jgi:hypothetical protein